MLEQQGIINHSDKLGLNFAIREGGKTVGAGVVTKIVK
jgi:translation elongation factor EF-Tu-like GTPase